MNRREFVLAGAAATLSTSRMLEAQVPREEHHLPPKGLHNDSPGVIEEPVPSYRWAPDSSYEAFRDMKFGVRVHWGMYSYEHLGNTSWPFLGFPYEKRAQYNDLYKGFNPTGFDAKEWMNLFEAGGAKMFTITTKHHEGFSLYDTKANVKRRVNWAASGGPKMEDCDFAYSIMNTPYRRDIIKELCDEAHKVDMKIDLYFSHIDFYDADFRPYNHPLQVPSSVKLTGQKNYDSMLKHLKGHVVIVPDPTPAEVKRMMGRHRAQLTELLTNYGKIDMLGLDLHFGPAVWPEMRETVLKLRELQPDVMIRNRGIGEYGDYYTPEHYIPSKEQSDSPWFVIYPLGKGFEYDGDASDYKGTQWIVDSLVDSVAKGGNFMVAFGPDVQGKFHPEAVKQLLQTGAWLRVNGEAIYATRARGATNWSEGDSIRYTRTKDKRTVYAIAMAWPGKELRLTLLKPRAGSEIRMLGYPEALAWKYDAAAGLTITLPDSLQDPAKRPCEYAWSLRVECDPDQAVAT